MLIQFAKLNAIKQNLHYLIQAEKELTLISDISVTSIRILETVDENQLLVIYVYIHCIFIQFKVLLKYIKSNVLSA